MIAGEQDVAEREAQMVGRMPRRRDGGERPALPFEGFAIFEDAVRRIIEIEGGIRARAVVGNRERRATDDRCAGRRCECAARRAVIAVGVRAQDRAHPAAHHGGENRIDMSRIVRPRIDHRDLGRADKIGLGPLEGEGRRIAGKDATDARRHLLGSFIRRLGHARHVARLATGSSPRRWPKAMRTACRAARMSFPMLLL